MNTPCIANHGLSPAHASVIVARCVAFCKLSPILVPIVPEQLLPLVDVAHGAQNDQRELAEALAVIDSELTHGATA